MRLHHVLRPLLLTLLVLLSGVGWAQDGDGSTSQTFDRLIVETSGVENTDWTWDASGKIFTVLTSTPVSFSTDGTFTGQIAVAEGVTDASITIGSLTIDRGAVWASGGSAGLLIGKNATATITLKADAEATIRGAWEQESMTVSEGASVIITGTGSLTVNSGYPQGAGHGAAIYLPKTATMTVNNGKLTARSYLSKNGEGAAIGGKQYDHETGCGTLIINGGEVTLISVGDAAAFGGGSSCWHTSEYNGGDGGTLIVNGGTLTAQGRIGGGGGESVLGGKGGSGGSITINGGTVTSTMDLGSADNATSAGSITLNGGTLTTPSIVSDGTSITFIKDITLVDNYTLTLPSTTAEGVTVTKADGISYTASKEYSYNTPSLVDGVYEIRNLNHLKWFRDLVNGNLTDGTEQDKSANAKLMADLDLEYDPWQSIGNYAEWHDVKYSGTFDGNYHTISNLKITKADWHAGLFGTIWGGHIKNLGVINADISGVVYAGSVISGLAGGGSIIENCYSVGTLNFSSNGQSSGITTSQDGTTIKNCHTSYSNISYENNGGCPMVNCKTDIPSDCYKTGELTWLLNTNKQTDETCSWGQTIGTDAHPVALTTDNAVYQYGKVQEAKDLTLGTSDATGRMTTLCYPREVTLPENVMAFTVTGLDGTDITISQPIENTIAANTPVILLNAGTTNATVSLPATNGIFSNSATASTAITADDDILTGTYSDLTALTDAQYCFATSSFSHMATMLSAYQCYLEYTDGADTYTPEIAQYLTYPTKNSEDYYEIYTATQLKWFRDLVNGTLTETAGNNNANGKLMADIDLNNEPWTPIGQNGTLDDVYVPSYMGYFDGNYHTVSNLNIEKGTYRGFIGYAADRIIKNLGIVNATANGGQYVGAIVGYASQLNMYNCWTGGELNLSADDGGLVAGIVNAEYCCKATNCHTSYGTAVNEVKGTGGNTITNCTANLSTDAYKTGELAYLLNANKESDETGWGQTIGTDTHPVALIDGTNNVYKYGTAQDATTLEIKADNRYNRVTTLCFPKEVSLPQGVMAFTVTGIDETHTDQYSGNVVMNKLETSVLPANTPAVLMNTGTETAKVQLPSVPYSYSNNATESTIVTQEGNLLKGTYSQMAMTSTQYRFGGFSFNSSDSYSITTVNAYQCYLDIENGVDFYCYETSEPIGDIEYAVLSEDDKTCYVSRIFYAGIGTSNYEVTIPSTTQINGEDYKVVQLGLCTDDDADNVRFMTMNYYYNGISMYINLPKTIKTASKQALHNSNSVYGTTIRFSTDEAPEFKCPNSTISYWGGIEVPYAAEDVYKAAWGNDHLYTSSRKTEVSIADGSVLISGNQYSRNGADYADINGTLVINGTSTTNYIYVNNGTADEPLRIAINGLSIDQSEVGEGELPAMILYSNANVSLIVQGDNTFKNSSTCCSIDITEGGSLVINSLSTGTLNLSGGISGDGIAVAAKVYSGSSDYTTQNVTASTTIDTDNNQLAFSDYDLVTNVDNLVANGTCSKFVLNDAVDVYSPSDFKASEVSYRRTFSDNEFNSLYLPFGASVDNFTDCEFYIINMFHQNDTDGDGVLDNITLEVSKVPTGSILLPNHPYLFKYKGTKLNETLEFSLTDIDVKATESASFECASMSYKYRFTGNYQSKTATDYADYYVIGIDSETGKTALVHPTEALPAMRWAMQMKARDSQLGTTLPTAPARVPIVISGEGNLTGISSVKTEAEGNAYYGINGVRKSQMTKGLNIVKTADGRVVKVLKR